ncbi:hypothetical protein BCR34DRAFT_570447 [Clohesyomyces aquaticus]|uniref:Uncharacterized protein n=1 Tax=Clohesyomyces aquaticus TaxID=1231657 RepID=A0A1Y1ZBU2_9PLEO|nr:hypothetical protein BCR34DRAFT_570447 [Clohesyomyces aquaticus]
MFPIKTLSCLFLAMSSVLGSPVDANGAAELAVAVRYVPGSVSDATRDLKKDPSGVWTLGNDGVLRSFTNDLTVIDYRNLDPIQFNELHTKHLEHFQNAGVDLPETFKSLSGTTVDGRLVTDISKLLHPEDTPRVVPAPGRHSTPVKRSQLEHDTLEARQNCGNPACESLSACLANFCTACFFPLGPPAGICF